MSSIPHAPSSLKTFGVSGQLRYDDAGRGGVDVLAQHNDAVIEQAGEDVIAALTARSLFDNIRYKAHSGFPPWCFR